MTSFSDAVSYRILTASDEDEMAQLLGELFSHHDPPAVAVGLTSAEFEAFVRLFCPKAVAEGLTVVARSATTGEIVGALLTEDSASTPPDTLSQVSAKFHPIFDILGQLDAEYRGGQAVRLGASIHLFLLGVARRFGGRGIAHQLVGECLANGVRKGYRLAVTEATNRTSQHIFRKQGFVERVRRSYGEHRFEGEAAFASIAGEGGPILLDKMLVS